MNPLYNRLGWQTVLIVLLWSILIGSVMLAALPRNPISLPYVPKLLIKTFVPQGWSFFTRNPRENLIYIYKRTGDTWAQSSDVINGSAKNYFGASRKARAMGSEYALLFSLAGVKWDSCATGKLSCVEESKKLIVRNKLTAPQLCGEFLFVSRSPVPWAWSAHAAEIELPFQYVLVDFVCE